MKKFFIFLFSVFLITFMGCSPATGEIPETPIQEATEETFEVFALGENGEDIAGLSEINELLNSELRSFYKDIKINNKIYTLKGLENNSRTFTDKDNNEVHIYYFNNYWFDTPFSPSPLNFRDFYMNTPICFDGCDIHITFSDLYEEVVQ